MGVAVLILGESGSGKSTSLRNFEEGEIGILNVMGKQLPFRKKMKLANPFASPNVATACVRLMKPAMTAITITAMVVIPPAILNQVLLAEKMVMANPFAPQNAVMAT